MKCDELTIINVDKMGDIRSLSGCYYHKGEVDDAITELKCDYEETVKTNTILANNCVKYLAEIKELKAKIEDLQASHYAENVDANMALIKAEKALRHQKYKRCMGMGQILEHITPITNRKAKWRDRWHKRWLSLAYKFKEA